MTYNKDAHERDPQDLSWVDTSLKTSVERISVHLDAIFLVNLLVSKCIYYKLSVPGITLDFVREYSFYHFFE